MFEFIGKAFDLGGVNMYVILVTFVFMLGVLVERIVVLPKDLAATLYDYAAAHGDKPGDTAIDILAEFFDRLTEPYDGEVLP